MSEVTPTTREDLTQVEGGIGMASTQSGKLVPVIVALLEGYELGLKAKANNPTDSNSAK